ncbi:MAG: hypothetical protein Q8R07_03860 [Candidatus Uhrbacteria bacterium]|nr:hypothetical protein [Candidatus Uhrbacteria bacterium]
MNEKRRKEYASMFASLGGKARAKKLTAEERSAIATHAVKARWAKVKRMKKLEKGGHV